MKRKNLPGERWLPVVGYEGLYEVSDMGRVWSVPRTKKSAYGSLRLPVRGRMMKPWMKAGYPTATLTKDGKCYAIRVHVLVLEAFIGPRPPGYMCCHKDDHRTNNRSTNLRWGTKQDNVADARANGRYPKGNMHPMALLKQRRVAGETT